MEALATAANLSYSNKETLRFPLAFDALITPHELQMPYPLGTGLGMTHAGRAELARYHLCHHLC